MSSEDLGANLSPAMRGSGAAMSLLLSAALTGCAAGPRPCVSPSCGDGAECIANRCSVAGTDPVSPGTDRIVLEPIAIAAQGEGRDATPGALTLGGAGSRPAALYLRFGTSWKAARDVRAAFLLLTPAPGTAPSPRAAAFDVWTVGAHWSTDDIARGVVPRLTGRPAPGLAAPSASSVVRVDVTRLVRPLRAAPHDDGLAVVAPRAGGPLTLLTGAAGGGAPRLELYVRAGGTRARAW